MKGAAPRRRTPPLPAPVEGPSGQPSALARLGLEAGKQVRHDLLRRLHQGDVKFACRLTHSRTVIVLDYAGREVSFLYSNSTKEILRFLAPNAPETENWRQFKAVGGVSRVPVHEPDEAAS